MKNENRRSSFRGSIGFVLAAAGSAVGLGNIWRFPYLAAKDGGGLFLVIYLALVLTFGFALLTTEIAIGRKTKLSPLMAYRRLHPRWKPLGKLACLVPMIILPYYFVVGGWVMKYMVTFLMGGGIDASGDGYFGGFITGEVEPIVYTVVFLLITSCIVYLGVNKGIELSSKILMPLMILLVIGISLYSLTLSYTDEDGVTRTGMEGLKVLVVPDMEGVTFQKILITLMDAMGQLFYSLSVAMGIMISYGSYVSSDDNLVRDINKIEVFDTAVAFLAGVMIIPAVFVFMGREGMSASGPGLMFISIPKVFASMGAAGSWIGAIFFVMAFFAALTSAVSMLEAIVSSFIDRFKISRRRSIIYEGILALALAVLVCLGYNVLYFDVKLPNGINAQILDIMDYVSNNVLMPLVAIGTCILIGWVLKPDVITDELTRNGETFSRRGLYVVMVRFVAPAMLLVLLLKSVGVI
ncbi:MAG: sodium-dependent transporter [Bacteroidales bacterium]|nr:sodium-dependent transporter [Bacteroidales bacterium]